MATRMADDEGWEDLALDELSSTDPGVVVRIQDLLRAAQGRPGQNREGAEQSKALALLRQLTLDDILNACSMYLHRPEDHPDSTALADRIFASHAWGAPFIADGSYRTWLDIWQPERGPLRVLVHVTASSRCLDWLASIGRDPNIRFCRSLEAMSEEGHAERAAGIEPSRPDKDFEFAELGRIVAEYIDRMPASKARDAIRARAVHSKSAAEYAAEIGTAENAANNLMARGAIALVKAMIEAEAIGEGFGRNIISVGQLSRKVLARFRDGKTLKDCWKDSEDGSD